MTISSAQASVRPGADEYFEYYNTYISKVPDGNIVVQLRDQIADIESLYRPISEEESLQIHPPYTWTIRQVMGHLIDTERIFADRLHKFSMGETQEQPGMDQDVYVASADYASVTLSALVDELVHCRRANDLLVRRLTDQAWNRRGIASGYAVTVRALAWMLVGHVNHHSQIVKKRIANPEAVDLSL